MSSDDLTYHDLTYWKDWIRNYHDQAINYDLTNVSIIAAQLDLQKFAVPVITVAGTNGKGSSIATMEAVLLAHGYKVAAYTSPHLFEFTERIRINGAAITVTMLCAAMQTIQQAVINNNNIVLTFFEFATLAALLIFKQHQLDIILLEVGLGGRLDAVNVVANDVALITSISLDHCSYLGNTVEAIAYEKAGIIKPNTIAIYSEPEVPFSIIQQAQLQGATLQQLGITYNYFEHATTWNWHGATQQFKDLALPSFPLQNAAAAIQAVSLLPNVQLKGSIVSKALENLTVAGRFQTESLHGREFIFDVAHNPAAVQWLVNKLQQRPAVGKTIAILAIAATKDCVAMLKNWNVELTTWLICAPQSMRRATTTEQLTKVITANQSAANATVQAVATVAAAMQLAHAQSVAKDRVVVFGSFHTVSAALTEFRRIKQHG